MSSEAESLLARTMSGYAIGERIGAGGMGEVFEARHRATGEVIAVKLLREGDPDALLRFKREFRALANVQHENLVALGELHVTSEGPAFLTMERIEGRPFDQYVRGHVLVGEPPNPMRLARALRQLALGVLELHARGCVHRDLKPSNVLVTREGRVVVLDFGLIAEATSPVPGPARRLLGTPAYMAPEQGRGEAGPACDAYAIGVMLYEALTGQRPFRGAGVEVLVAKLEQDPPEPSPVVVGVAPELVALCRRLLAPDPEQRAGVTDILPVVDAVIGSPSGRASSGRRAFVGRARELAFLHARHAAYMASRRSLAVHVRGRSGLGKSALLERFLAQLAVREPDLLILRGRIYERESVPYKGIDAIIDALRVVVQPLPDHERAKLAPQHVGALARMFPLLGDLWPSDARELLAFEPGERRERGVAALRELLSRLAERSPLLVFLDDFQWADIDSARLLTQLLRPPEPPAIAWLIAFRSDEADSNALQLLLDPELRRGRELHELELEPLDDADALALASSMLESSPAPERLAGLLRRAAGNPFYLAQALLGDGNGLEPDSVDLVLSESDDPPTPGRGGSLDRLVVRRIAALATEEREVLALIAVAGVPVSLALLDESLARPTFATLARLERAGLVRRSDAGVETAHDRIREITVGELEANELSAIHQSLARALEAAGAPPETLAKHFEAAREPERAAEWTERAAVQAIEAVAFERAVELLRRTLVLVPADDVERRRRVESALAEQLANLGRGLEASSHFVALAETSHAGVARRHRRRAAELLLARGRVAEGIALFRATLDELGERLPRGWLGMLGQIMWERLRLALRGEASRVRSEAELDPRMLERIDTLYAAIRALSGQELVLAFALQSRGFRLALDAGEPRRLVEYHVYESVLAATAGDRRRAERLVAFARELVATLDDRYLDALLDFHRVIFAYFLTGSSGGAADMRALKQRLEGIPGSHWMQPNLSIWTTSSALLAGDYVELARDCPAWLALARARGNPQEIADLASLLAVARIHGDDAGSAEPLLALAREAWSVPHVAVPDNQLALAECTALMWAGDDERAAERAEQVLRSLLRWMVVLVLYDRHALRDLAGRAWARVALARPHDRRARKRALGHARALRRVGQPRGRGRAALIEAALHVAAGEPAQAQRCWAEAERELDAAGMHGYLAAARMRRDDAHARALAEAYFAAQGIVAVDRYVHLLAPGLS
jgi:hypothetical protein